MYTNLPTSQGYIFRILQHFATKLCSFSNFDNFFPEISFVIPRLKIFLKRKSSIDEGKEVIYEVYSIQCSAFTIDSNIGLQIFLLLVSKQSIF